MENGRKYYVDGFAFTGEEEAKQAKKEIEGIHFIKEQLDMENPELVLEIYHRILSENLFETPVGIYFLKELQEYLMALPGIRDEEIEPILINSRMKNADRKKMEKEEPPKAEKETKKEKAKQPQKQVKLIEKHINYKGRYRILSLVSVVLFVVVVALFVIESTSNSPNILNYENEVINRYAEWEQQLNEKEKELKDLEKRLQEAE